MIVFQGVEVGHPDNLDEMIEVTLGTDLGDLGGIIVLSHCIIVWMHGYCKITTALNPISDRQEACIRHMTLAALLISRSDG